MSDGIVDEQVESAHDAQRHLLGHAVSTQHVPAGVLHGAPLFGNRAQGNSILAPHEAMAFRDQLAERLVDVLRAVARTAENPGKDLGKRVHEARGRYSRPQLLLDQRPPLADDFIDACEQNLVRRFVVWQIGMHDRAGASKREGR